MEKLEGSTLVRPHTGRARDYLSLVTIIIILFIFCSNVKEKSFRFYSRGKITVKGLGERLTYFVEPPNANADMALLGKGEKSLLRKPSSSDDAVSFTEFSSIVKLPPISGPNSPEHLNSSPFVEDDKNRSGDPTEVKMVKPHLPITKEKEEASKNTTTKPSSSRSHIHSSGSITISPQNCGVQVADDIIIFTVCLFN